MPLCLGTSGSVRATSDAAVGDVGERGPHLLAVDDPLVAVAHGAGRQAGEVGAGAGLAEQLAPDLLAGEQRPQAAALAARRVPWVDDRRRRHVRSPITVDGVRRGAPAAGKARVDRALPIRLDPEAAGALGEVHPRQPGVEAGVGEGLCVRRGRRRLFEHVRDPALHERGGVGRRRVGHACLARTAVVRGELRCQRQRRRGENGDQRDKAAKTATTTVKPSRRTWAARPMNSGKAVRMKRGRAPSVFDESVRMTMSRGVDEQDRWGHEPHQQHGPDEDEHCAGQRHRDVPLGKAVAGERLDVSARGRSARCARSSRPSRRRTTRASTRYGRAGRRSS